VLTAILLGAAATALALAQLRRRPALATGWLWFLVCLAPASGIVQFGAHAMADRFAYLPSIGLFAALAWLAAGALAPRTRLPAALAAAAALTALVGAAARQAAFWKDSETLFRRTLAVTNGNWLIGNNLAGVLARQGRHEEAIESCRRALQAQPGYPEAHYNLGVSLAALGRHGEAIASYREALRFLPGYAKAHGMLGNSLFSLGRPREAIASYREALRLRPGIPEVWLNLGLVLAAEGRTAEAAEALREALRLRPGYPNAQTALERLAGGARR
jgi:tetratricopeptide (TPR) repeat protein